MPKPRRKSKADVYDLLSRWSLDSGGEPHSNEALSHTLWDECGAQRAVLISDLSGFTRITRSHGILQFLAVFQRAHQIGELIFERHGGRFLKAQADNLFALFDTAGAACAAGQAMMREASKHNARFTDPAGQVHFCIGIAFGKILELTDDAYGDAVNVAFKLGEDIAEAGQILLSEEAAAELRTSRTHADLARALEGPFVVEAGHVLLQHWRLPPA